MSSSPSSQQFCLRWNNHQAALVTIFEQLLKSEAFVDVTLAVEGILVRAHKLVLSACSSYFQVMFASHPSKHPIVFLKDVCYSDLRALLDFMYKGEVEMDQDRLPSFLRLAESLKVRGLAEFCEESFPQPTLVKANDAGAVFDSLLETQRRIQQTLTNSAAVELLPRNSEMLNSGLLKFNSPLALATHKLGESPNNLDFSNILKRPLETSLPYVPHRRKRGRPPRHSGHTNVEPSNTEIKEERDATLGSKSDMSYEQNSDSVLASPVENGSAAEDPSTTSHEDKEVTPVASSTPDTETPKDLLIDDQNQNNPLPGTSRELDETSDVAIIEEAKGKKQRGRPRGYSRIGADSGERPSPTEQLQEMSIRGLNLFRYASVSDEGVYQCIPCGKDQITRTFKNKYSFQRHAYLYHEGNQRKVFPCVVCGREFSRPDKLKHHLKTTHEYTLPRDYSSAFYTVP